MGAAELRLLAREAPEIAERLGDLADKLDEHAEAARDLKAECRRRMNVARMTPLS